MIRAKRNTYFYVCAARTVDKASGLLCDQTIRLNSKWALRNYTDGCDASATL